MLKMTTPVVLTYDEEPNVARCLDHLQWARRVLVVDSFSRDRTVEIAKSYQNVVVVQRDFLSFADQWSWAVQRPEIETEWVIALDADYVVPSRLVEEMEKLSPDARTDGYRTRFAYAVHGRLLRGSLYPPLITLFRRRSVWFEQRGHNQIARVPTEDALSAPIIHDDRKRISRWIRNQIVYQSQEADILRSTPSVDLDILDRLRKRIIIAPLLTPVYLLLYRGLLFDGRAGLHYTLQRTVSEIMLSLFLLDRILQAEESSTAGIGGRT